MPFNGFYYTQDTTPAGALDCIHVWRIGFQADIPQSFVLNEMQKLYFHPRFGPSTGGASAGPGIVIGRLCSMDFFDATTAVTSYTDPRTIHK